MMRSDTTELVYPTIRSKCKEFKNAKGLIDNILPPISASRLQAVMNKTSCQFKFLGI